MNNECGADVDRGDALACGRRRRLGVGILALADTPEIPATVPMLAGLVVASWRKALARVAASVRPSPNVC
jgi:hypothetical protein